ncbi:MAG: hypothetical protein ACKVE4_05090 [Dissulfuribacterales bacterium]
MKQILLLIIILFILAGCLTAPPHESLQRSCGPYPTDYKAIIKNYLNQDLKHPESLKDFSVIKPPEIIILDTRYPIIRLHKGFEVWECFIVYDAKNDQGVYVGKDLHVARFRFNRLVAFDYEALDLEYRIEERIKNPGY